MGIPRLKQIYLGIIVLALVFSGCSSDSRLTTTEPAVADRDTQEPYEVVMSVLGNRELPDLELVEKEVNQISMDKIGVKVRLLHIGSADIRQAYALKLASNEKLDLILLFSNSIGEFAARNQILQLDELVAAHGQDILAAEGVAMSGGYFSGKLYGIPSEEKMGRSYGIVARTDLIEKYNVDLNDINSYEDLEPVFQKITEKEPLMIPLECASDMFRYFHEIDTLGATVASGCLLNGGLDNTTVVNLFATPTYEKFVNTMYRWNQKGFFPENPETFSLSKGDLTRDGLAFAYPQNTELEMAGLVSDTVNRPMTAIQLTRGYATTSMYQITQWAITTQSENPAKTMEFLNLLYEDETIINLLSNGIEGLHYERTEFPQIIRRPPGVTATNSGYEMTGKYFGDKALKYAWEPVEPDIFEQLQAFNERVLRDGASQALGYVFDPTNTLAQVYQIEQVIGEYRYILETGCVDPAIYLPQFISALESAGIDAVIAENQRQLDNWLAQQSGD